MLNLQAILDIETGFVVEMGNGVRNGVTEMGSATFFQPPYSSQHLFNTILLHHLRHPTFSSGKWGQPPFFSLPTPLNTRSIPYFFTTFDTQPSLPYGILLSSERSRASSSGTVRGLFNSFR
jgi:hypothetical protein